MRLFNNSLLIIAFAVPFLGVATASFAKPLMLNQGAYTDGHDTIMVEQMPDRTGVYRFWVAYKTEDEGKDIDESGFFFNIYTRIAYATSFGATSAGIAHNINPQYELVNHIIGPAAESFEYIFNKDKNHELTVKFRVKQPEGELLSFETQSREIRGSLPKFLDSLRLKRVITDIHCDKLLRQ